MGTAGRRESKVVEIIRALQSRRLKKGRDAPVEDRGKERGLGKAAGDKES